MGMAGFVSGSLALSGAFFASTILSASVRWVRRGGRGGEESGGGRGRREKEKEGKGFVPARPVLPRSLAPEK